MYVDGNIDRRRGSIAKGTNKPQPDSKNTTFCNSSRASGRHDVVGGPSRTNDGSSARRAGCLRLRQAEPTPRMDRPMEDDELGKNVRHRSEERRQVVGRRAAVVLRDEPHLATEVAGVRQWRSVVRVQRTAEQPREWKICRNGDA